MTPLDRLLAEEIPTGLFGDAPEQRPPRRTKHRPPDPPIPAPDPQAAAHRAELPNPYAPKTPRPGTRRRHLRAVPPAA